MGAISHMNQLYRENMQKLRSSRYNKKNSGKFAKPNSYKSFTGNLNVPELSFQEREKLRRAIEERSRRQRIRIITALLIGSVFLALAIGWLIQTIQASSLTEQIAEEDNVEYQKQEYARYLSYGDEYLNKSQWYNAAFEYRTSLKFNPESEVALYRLTFSLMRLCEAEQRGCDEADNRLNTLLQKGYNPEDLEELTLRWEGILQRKP
ncbi:hypothetical protein O3Q51_11825 [Cryomorphaceae bacterium 1068]|nr:hypothetical protein [Cryomorphaceae bacterium 1068]